MRPLFSLLLVFASVTPALADNLFTQTRIKVQGTIVDDGGQKYSLTTTGYTAKALVQNVGIANLHSKWAARVGQEAKTASQLVFGNVSEAANATTNSAVYAAVFGEGEAPFLSSYTHQHKTGTVAEVSTGVYQFTSDSVTYNVLVPGGAVFTEAATVLAAAATSGDPITVGGYYCYRGDAAGSQDKFFVVEDFVE